MADSATITVTGTVTSSAEATADGLALSMTCGPLLFRIVAPGDTLEGFSPGDHQTFVGRVVRVMGNLRIVVRVQP